MKGIAQRIGMLSVILSASVLSCHARAAQGLTQKALRPLIQQQCQQELHRSKAWQVSMMFMATAKKQKAQQSICGCVNDHAMDDVSVRDLITEGVSEERKHQLAKRMVLNSFKGCAEDLLH